MITYFTHSNNEYDCTIICTILYYIITYICLRLKTTDWSEEEEEAVTVAAATNSPKYLKGTVTPAAIYILYIEVLGIFFFTAEKHSIWLRISLTDARQLHKALFVN